MKRAEESLCALPRLQAGTAPPSVILSAAKDLSPARHSEERSDEESLCVLALSFERTRFESNTRQ